MDYGKHFRERMTQAEIDAALMAKMEADEKEIARLRDENANLTHENDRLWAELRVCAAALPGAHYMDPPDGGSVTVAEQVARMAKDAERYRLLRNYRPGLLLDMLSDTGSPNDAWAQDLDATIDAMQEEK